ncbi:MAG: dodecin family protein [Smithellaceae bacterium]|nr:dodecin family protein [Smithellaceae bacterium]
MAKCQPSLRQRVISKLLTKLKERQRIMSNVYKVIEIIGSSDTSWEDAAKKAVEVTAKSLDEIRIAEVKELDMRVEKGKVVEYRAKLRVSFKYKPE